MADTNSPSQLYNAFARAPVHFERGAGVRLGTRILPVFHAVPVWAGPVTLWQEGPAAP